MIKSTRPPAEFVQATTVSNAPSAETAPIYFLPIEVIF